MVKRRTSKPQITPASPTHVPLALLTKFPNVIEFRTGELTELRKRPKKRGRFYPKSDNRLKHIAKAFPRLKKFMVISDKSPSYVESEELELVIPDKSSSHVPSDVLVGPKGLRALGKGCSRLATLVFDGSNVVGNAGMDAFFHSPRKLRCLYLVENHIISDPALRAIASSSISTLELVLCTEITDVGLGLLATGTISKTLKKLIIECCPGITDAGIQLLVKMSCLEHLDLCRQQVTDVGGVAIARIQTLRELRLSDVSGFSDTTVVALAENCRNLEVLALCCDGVVTAAGIRALSSHQRLKHYAFFGVKNIRLSDMKGIVCGCPSLESLVIEMCLHRSFVGPITKNNNVAIVIKRGSFYSPLPHFKATEW